MRNTVSYAEGRESEGMLRMCGASQSVFNLVRVLSAAALIQRHEEYYLWLQNEIGQLLPHEVLLAAWGDFESGVINCDVASSIPGVNTQKFRDSAQLRSLSSCLYGLTENHASGWYLLNDLEHGDTIGRISKFIPSCKLSARGVKSLLVYSMRCEGEADRFYAFYSSTASIVIDQTLLDLIMPHIDATLRRVKCLPPREVVGEFPTRPGSEELTGRESEVLNWLSQGKSNSEIGVILGISPNTVKNHLKRIFEKLGVTSRAEAVRLYCETNAHSLNGSC